MKTYIEPISKITDCQASYMLMQDASAGGVLSGISYEPVITPIDIH